jgi:hypothetical protein
VKRRLAVVVATVLVLLGFPAPAVWADSLAEREADYLSALRGNVPFVISDAAMVEVGFRACNDIRSGRQTVGTEPTHLLLSGGAPEAWTLSDADMVVGAATGTFCSDTVLGPPWNTTTAVQP